MPGKWRVLESSPPVARRPRKARGLLGRLAQGIRAVGAFTALAGIAILLTGVAADASRRGREVALLQTLGTTRAGVVGLFAIEYAIAASLAGILGAMEPGSRAGGW